MRDPVGKVFRMMYRDDEREFLRHQASEQPFHGRALARIEPGQRFIQHEDGRIRGQRPREQCPA